MSFRKPATRQTQRRLELFFLGALILSMVIATGPGVLLVNRPETMFGFPIIYVWGVAWYAVIGTLAVTADRLVWKKECEIEESESSGGDADESGT